MKTDRKTLHRLIDALPESGMEEVERYLQTLLSDSVPVPMHDTQEEAGCGVVDEGWLKMDFLQTQDAQKQFSRS